ncbi:MAG: aldehyde dehydrogenase family protein [Armatimonadetes bacterium]|nr:aldehyde dehydrogenase family protein [Armatimonadota bacterium]
MIRRMVERAREAQGIWEKADQERIDAVVREIGKTIYDNAEELARLTVEETGVGNYEYNLKQDKRKSCIIWHSLKGRPSVGIIERDKKTGLVTIAKPIGVVGAVLPVTIPVTNFMSNCMFSVKARNAVIGAPHPKAKRTVARTVELILSRIDKFSVPENLIQCLAEPSIELTSELMKQVDVIVATGGMGMVRAAYSSGKPAYGVGPGNVQCIIDRGVDIGEAIEKIIEGRVFNNGLPCACEQAVIVPYEDAARILKAFEERQCVYIEDEEEIERVARVLYVDGVLSRDGIGLTAHEVARKASISVPKDSKVLLLKGDLRDDNILRKEKLSPVTLFYTYDRFEEAIDIARRNTNLEGKGHSVAIHSNNEANIEALAHAMDVSRVIVNQCATTSAGGSFLNGFGATTTLGTGFWGNNILNGNLDFVHLMNYTKIGYAPDGARVPTDEEIWG